MNTRAGNKRLSFKKYVESDSESETSPPSAKKVKTSQAIENANDSSPKKIEIFNVTENADDSSSDSSIGDHLQRADEINLDADSFRTKADTDFKSIEKKILSDVNNLSESDSESDFQEVTAPVKKQNTQPEEEFEPTETKHEYIPLQLNNFTEKIEEAKRQLSKFNEKKFSASEEKLDIGELLALGESEIIQNDNSSLIEDDSSCSELEEVAEEGEDLKEAAYSIPKEGVQITLEVPGLINKKKKALDVIACLKRKSNRVKKECQVYKHKVHLLCWLAHGNYINAILNNENLLALALSLIPSQHCYPEDRVNLKYLEQITNWYTKIVKLKPDDPNEKTKMKPISLQQSLHLQINRKEVKSKKDYVYIFICILRSLGIRCRLVLSFQVVPLRPPSSELFSLSTKTDDEKNDGKSNKPETSTKSTKTLGKKDIGKAGPSSLGAKKVMKKNESSSAVEKVQTFKSEKLKDNVKAGPSRSNTKKETEPKRKTNDTLVKKEQTSKNKNISLKLSKDKETTKAGCNSSNIDKDKLQISKSKSVNPKLNENKEKRKAANRSSKTKSDVKKGENLSQENGPRKSQFFRQPETNDDQKQKKAVKSKLTMLKKRGEETETKATSDSEKQKKVSRTEETETNDTQKQKKVIKSRLTIRTEEAETKATSEINDSEKQKKVSRTEETETNDSEKQKKVIKSKLTIRTEEAETKATSETDMRSEKKSARKTRSKSANIETFKILQVDGMNDVGNKKSTKQNSAKVRKSDKNNTDSESQSSRPSRTKKVAKYTEVNSNETDSDSEENETLKSLRKLKNAKTSPFFGTPANQKPAARSRLSLSARKVVKSADVARSKSNENTTSKFFDGPSSKTKSNLDVRNDIVNLLKSRISEQKHIDKSKLVKSKVKNVQSDDDSDYAPEPIAKKKKTASDSDSDFDLKSKKKIKSKVKQLKEIDRRVLSTDSEEENPQEKKKKRIGNDIWVEVFVEDEEKWISVDVTKGQVHCVQELHSRASQPVAYIIAWNNDNMLKDVSRRYCKQWNTVTRKLRVDSQWWEKSLKPFTGRKTARDKEEDEELARQQLEQPLPTTISEYKDHPLYALKRHLLKFQAIYPPDAATLGFVRNEPVYARECVYTLHSRETWIKQAKCVKIGEKPYKIVKARPKYDRATGTMITDLPLDVFGVWQVEDYKPPVAENGIVPRNCYGNVDLFKPTMLPIGTVHLQLPGLNKVARKLNIDCSPAVVGWDFHSGGSHPTFDGFVVCKEYEETLIAAWEQEQEEAEKRAREKIEKRVYDNWRRIIKGVLIRERLKAKYGFGDPSTSTGGKKKKKPKGPRFVAKKRRICSDNSDSD